MHPKYHGKELARASDAGSGRRDLWRGWRAMGSFVRPRLGFHRILRGIGAGGGVLPMQSGTNPLEGLPPQSSANSAEPLGFEANLSRKY